MAEKTQKVLHDPKDIHADSKLDYIDRAWLYYNQNRYTESVADFRKALNLDSQDISTFYALGLSLKANGEKEEAKNYFMQVIKNSDDADRAGRSQMFKTLAEGQLNQIEKETW